MGRCAHGGVIYVTTTTLIVWSEVVIELCLSFHGTERSFHGTERSFHDCDRIVPVDVYVPWCPPTEKPIQ
jgi:NADH:ubiquinone oxidoreductase subunit B-like Fe-S oxidoreductase